jgi:hypothetical protein
MGQSESDSAMYERMAKDCETKHADYDRSLGSGAGVRYQQRLAKQYRERAAEMRAKGR